MKRNNKAAPQPKKGKKKSDDGFDDFLKELSAVTAETGKEREKSKPVVTIEQRRQMHKDKREAEQKRGSDELNQYILQQQKQLQLQRLIDEMMRSPFNAKANTDFGSQTADSDRYSAACGWMQGWRSSMEDAHVILPEFKKEHNAGLFAVFDGHAGAKCAQLCQAVLPVMSTKNYCAATKTIDFGKMYLDLDESLRAKMMDTSGCTAVTVLVNDTTVSCASVGDSRAVLCRADGRAVDLSDDHKPENAAERARIEAAGGHVSDNRVNGQLAMSRALGDFQYKRNAKLPVEKQLVIPNPDVVTVDREQGDQFVVVACDGIFDVLSNQEVCDFVRQELQTNLPLVDICKKVCMFCLAPEDENGRPSRAAGTDNMTITIVRFK